MINPDEPIPAYIHIDSVVMNIDPVEDGRGVHNITDVWVDLDGTRLGTFEIPVTFPVIAEGTHTLHIQAGIKENGKGSTRVVYPFYTDYRKIVNFQPEDVLDITPEFSYIAEAVTDSWREEFEHQQISIDTSGLSTVPLLVENDDLYEGNEVGKVYMTNDNAYFECINNEAIEIPWNYDDIYMELEYESNTPFTMGLIFNYINTPSITKPIITFNPRDFRNKIYVNISDVVFGQANAVSFYVYFNSNKIAGVDTSTILLDNIKLVHF